MEFWAPGFGWCRSSGCNHSKSKSKNEGRNSLFCLFLSLCSSDFQVKHLKWKVNGHFKNRFVYLNIRVRDRKGTEILLLLFHSLSGHGDQGWVMLTPGPGASAGLPLGWQESKQLNHLSRPWTDGKLNQKWGKRDSKQHPCETLMLRTMT